MRIAVIGDIHGNMEALKVAYEVAQKKVVPRKFFILVTLVDMPLL